ncbi:ABC transporter ATP-binding protein [Haloimpatiens lingqiaonensis]|uniref:ABC transporter ATP-binding protein n=1 Tax=Haloimpatiens lingqiaonensis TaxID=1380675 RepID=UPI0010FD247F|nr:ABC transporter ATP-binding protein [Haloimpatiens lingqiaonensis]
MIRNVINHTKKYKNYMMGIISLRIILWIVELIQPYIISSYIDKLKLITVDELLRFTKIIAVLFIIRIVISFINNIIITKFNTKSYFDLAYDVIEHVKRVPLFYFNDTNAAYLNERINFDSNEVVSFITNKGINFVINIFMCIGSLCFCFSISLKITLILSFSIPFNLIIYFKFKKIMYKLDLEKKEVENKFFSKINEQLYNISAIKKNCCFEFSGNKLKKFFSLVLDANMNFIKSYAVFDSAGIFIQSMSTLMLLLLGGLEIIKGRMSLGNFLAFNSYFPMFTASIQFFLEFGSAYQSTLVSYNRLKEIMDIEEENKGVQKLNEVSNIQLENVSFSYNSKKVISDISLNFDTGKIYFIVGENGSGKTTLINLITGLINSYSGDIWYNSKDIKNLDLYYVRKKHFGISEQEPILFNDTIMNNITFGGNIDTDIIENYAYKLNMKGLIKRLQKGLNTVITENSSNLSGGEKQKISQLKAFVKDPNVIILDEPSSALDKESINYLKRYLKDIKKDKIIIMVTHDKNMLDIADEVINLDNISCKKEVV